MELIKKMIHSMAENYLSKDFGKTTIKKADKEETKMKIVMPEEVKPKLETGYVPSLTKQEEIEKNYVGILEDTIRRTTNKDFGKIKRPTKVSEFYR